MQDGATTTLLQAVGGHDQSCPLAQTTSTPDQILTLTLALRRSRQTCLPEKLSVSHYDGRFVQSVGALIGRSGVIRRTQTW